MRRYPQHAGALTDFAIELAIDALQHGDDDFDIPADPDAISPVVSRVMSRFQNRLFELTKQGIRLLVVTGDLIEGTITPKLLERVTPGSIEQRRDDVGSLPTTTDMGEAIAISATDSSLPGGHTIVVGGPLESLSPLAGAPEG